MLWSDFEFEKGPIERRLQKFRWEKIVVLNQVVPKMRGGVHLNEFKKQIHKDLVNDWIWGDVKGESCTEEESFYRDEWWLSSLREVCFWTVKYYLVVNKDKVAWSFKFSRPRQMFITYY